MCLFVNNDTIYTFMTPKITLFNADFYISELVKSIIIFHPRSVEGINPPQALINEWVCIPITDIVYAFSPFECYYYEEE